MNASGSRKLGVNISYSHAGREDWHIYHRNKEVLDSVNQFNHSLNQFDMSINYVCVAGLILKFYKCCQKNVIWFLSIRNANIQQTGYSHDNGTNNFIHLLQYHYKLLELIMFSSLPYLCNICIALLFLTCKPSPSQLEVLFLLRYLETRVVLFVLNVVHCHVLWWLEIKVWFSSQLISSLSISDNMHAFTVTACNAAMF